MNGIESVSLSYKGFSMNNFKQLIDHVFSLQQDYVLKARLSTVSDRLQLLKHLEQVILTRRLEIENALLADLGKHRLETAAAEIYPVLSEIRLTQKKLRRWAKPKRVNNNLLFFGSKAFIVNEPLGQCLIISPWNYPFQLALTNVVAAVASGNTVILKPSEFVPNTNKVLAEIISEVFKPEQVTLIEGEIAETTYLLNKKFNHIHFTGSPAVGKIVMTAASKYLTSVTLELGGKSPLIIDSTLPLSEIMPKILWGKLINNGQTCIAPDYLLVDRRLEKELIKSFKETLIKLTQSSDGLSEDITNIINHQQFNRLKSYVFDAKEKGAIVEIGAAFFSDDLRFTPTLLTNVSSDMLVMQEEIFGPIFPVIFFDHTDEVVCYINKGDKPLVTYLFSNDSSLQKKISNETSSGALLINDTLVHVLHPNLPFGGVNHSGIGQSTGQFGYLTFTHPKAVLKTNRYLSLSRFLNFPYTDQKQRLMDFFMRYF